MSKGVLVALAIVCALSAAPLGGAQPSENENSPKHLAARAYFHCLLKQAEILDDGSAVVSDVAKAIVPACAGVFNESLDVMVADLSPPYAAKFRQQMLDERDAYATGVVLRHRRDLKTQVRP